MDSSLQEEMDALARQQEQLGKGMVKLHTNARKDASNKRTEPNLVQKLQVLEDLWKEIQKIHARIRLLDMPQHSYYTTNYFGQLRNQYDTTKSYLETSYLERVKPKATSEATIEEQDYFQSQAEKVKSPVAKLPTVPLLFDESNQAFRLKKQNVKIQQLQHTFQQINVELREGTSRSRHEALAKKLQKQWDAVDELNEELNVHGTTFENSYFLTNVFHQLETEVDLMMEKLDRKMYCENTWASLIHFINV